MSCLPSSIAQYKALDLVFSNAVGQTLLPRVFITNHAELSMCFRRPAFKFSAERIFEPLESRWLIPASYLWLTILAVCVFKEESTWNENVVLRSLRLLFLKNNYMKAEVTNCIHASEWDRDRGRNTKLLFLIEQTTENSPRPNALENLPEICLSKEYCISSLDWKCERLCGLWISTSQGWTW